MNVTTLVEQNPTIKAVSRGVQVTWINPDYSTDKEVAFAPAKSAGLSRDLVVEAAERLARFAPVIASLFPETKAAGGVIESPLVEIAATKERLNERFGAGITGRLFLKMDSHLDVAGSVKARGGIYEVLKHTEDLALAHGILSSIDDDHMKLLSPEAKEFFARQKIQVGSTGNLGMSIGIMGAAMGYRAIVHMSADAKQWKKDLLRERGVIVNEYKGDYGQAVKEGRAASDADPDSYFVDDENSVDLFCGYAVAGGRLKSQLDASGVTVDADHPLFVYIPCGVGGAPGGITYGLKLAFGENVHCFFAEPTHAPCMLLGLASGLHNGISVYDLGLDGITDADGLAVGRPSGFIGRALSRLIAGDVSVEDPLLYDYLRTLHIADGIFIEPSSCAAFRGASVLESTVEGRSFLRRHGLVGKMKNATSIVWATGGKFVPEKIREEYLLKGTD